MAKAQRRGDEEAEKPNKSKAPVEAPAGSSRGVLAAAVASPKAKKS